MNEPYKSEEIVGDCGVCSNSLPVGANHAYTVCGHLFCISCLLKWHKTNPTATCPMCRAPLYEDEEDAASNATAAALNATAEEAEAFEISHQHEQERTRETLEEMDFSDMEQSMHEYMMMVVDSHVVHYCCANPMCTYTGTTAVYPIPNQEHHYHRVEIGIQNVNCHYVIEMRNSSRAFRYKFGRIEDIINHHIFENISWFVFREMSERLDHETGYMHTEWANETQRIAFVDVNSLYQYVPRIRISV